MGMFLDQQRLHPKGRAPSAPSFGDSLHSPKKTFCMVIKLDYRKIYRVDSAPGLDNFFYDTDADYGDVFSV